MIVEDLKISILNKLLKGDIIKKYIDILQNDISAIDEQLPKDWKMVRLGDKLIIARGGSPRPIKSYITNDPNGINWIKIGDTEKGSKYIESCKEKIIESGVSKSRLVHKGDFLLSNSMSFGRPYILNIDGCIHDGWLVLTDKNNIFDKEYLFYVLSSKLVYEQFSSKAAGAVVSNLNTDKVRETIIPLPPLNEQKEIVKKIEELFLKLDEIKPIEEKLIKLKLDFGDNMLNAIYQSAMSGNLTKQKSNESAEEFLKEFRLQQSKHKFKKMKDIKKVDSDVPYSIPDNWCWERLGNLFEINLGFTYRPTYVEEGYKFLSVKDISSGVIDFENVKYISKEEYEKAAYGSKPLKGDILFGRVGTIGVPQIVETDEPFCIFVSLGFLRDFTNLMNKKYVCYWMNSSLFKKQVVENVSGTAQMNLNTNWLKNFYIPIPPLEEQQRIVEKIEKILPLVESIDELVKA